MSSRSLIFPGIAALRRAQSLDSESIAASGSDLVAVAKAEFQCDAALRAEFIDLETYTAWRKATAEGRVRILGGARQAALRATEIRDRASAAAASGELIALAKTEFEGDAALRREFVDLETYTAWRRATAAGRVRVLGGLAQ